MELSLEGWKELAGEDLAKSSIGRGNRKCRALRWGEHRMPEDQNGGQRGREWNPVRLEKSAHVQP